MSKRDLVTSERAATRPNGRPNKNGVPILLVEQNAKQALETADRGYVLVDGSNKVEGAGQDLINDRNVARMFLGK